MSWDPGDVADLAGGVSRDVDPRLVDSIFTGYGSHYLANPLLAPTDALDDIENEPRTRH